MWGVSWYEEPVSSADFEGLRLLRDRAPAGIEIAAGEYAYVPADFRNLVATDASTACRPTSRAAAASPASSVPARSRLPSSSTSPRTARRAASVAACCAVPNFRHLEYFHDHVRLEQMLFDGVLEPEGGALRPDRARPGHGLELKRADAERFAVVMRRSRRIPTRASRRRRRPSRTSTCAASSTTSPAAVDGEVRFRPGDRALYATGGSNYRQVPIGVVIPRTTDDVIETVRVCRDYGAPVLARGGGTSLAGQAATSPSSSTSPST